MSHLFYNCPVVSVYAALAVLAAGARGRTLQELLAALSAHSGDELAARVATVVARALADQSLSGGPAVTFASAVWHDAAFAASPAFRAAAAKSFNAESRAVDFHNELGSRGHKQPHQLETSLVITNAIYFKGMWEEPFNKAKTIVDKFYCLDGRTAKARFMRSDSSQFISVRDGLKVLKLPYQSSPPRHSMYVFPPDARHGQPKLVEKITSMPGFWRHQLPDTRVPVGEFRLPRLADLSDMGATAEGSAGGVLVFAGEVCHRAVVEVNEEGTEAVAATGMMFMPTCPRWSPPRLVDFVADHPFLFFVVEVSGAIMFVGHVLDPTN
ncbi:unnamed protein product [Urochloa decumbens]|uniref:Serpin domain-containing protein n=1 Tax=Urochloa decumbens TaxID=240449 RepID=A0ABC9AMU6_9POAL